MTLWNADLFARLHVFLLNEQISDTASSVGFSFANQMMLVVSSKNDRSCVCNFPDLLYRNFFVYSESRDYRDWNCNRVGW